MKKVCICTSILYDVKSTKHFKFKFRGYSLQLKVARISGSLVYFPFNVKYSFKMAVVKMTSLHATIHG